MSTPDTRPWEPLNGRTPRVGDEVRQEWYGVTRSGIVGRVDGNGDPWTPEGGYIGPILGGTWYTRPAASTLNPHSKLEDNPRDGDNMTTPRYTITRDRGPTPWTLARTTASGGLHVVGRYCTHAEAVTVLDWVLGRVSMPQAPQDGRTYGHTLVVMEDPVAARRRALKARRMAARRRARPVRVVPVWEPASARLERVVREALEATRADFTLAAPGGDA